METPLVSLKCLIIALSIFYILYALCEICENISNIPQFKKNTTYIFFENTDFMTKLKARGIVYCS